MPIFLLPREPVFPDPELADENGIIAAGGDLSPNRILEAYKVGIFPWPVGERTPLLWWSPDPRLVLDPARVHVGRSLRKVLRAGRFEVRADTAFTEVMRRCGQKRRPGQRGTWITPAMLKGYTALHQEGFAHSIEAWEEGVLVGGLYGISLGGAFFGESMFADRDDASKVAFVGLCERLVAWGFDFVDCQVTTEHLLRFGAEEMTRTEFLDRLRKTLCRETRRGQWT